MFDDLVVDKENWKEIIGKAFTDYKEGNISEYIFYDTIFEMSHFAFDKAREIQVLIDANDSLFITVGSPSFVSFDGQEDVLYESAVKIKFPLKCWIHTHPFGKAYFSSTDVKTARIWRHRMKEAVVIGNYEYFKATFEDDPTMDSFYMVHRVEDYTLVYQGE